MSSSSSSSSSSSPVEEINVAVELERDENQHVGADNDVASVVATSVTQNELFRDSSSPICMPVVETSRLYNLILMKKPWSDVLSRISDFPLDCMWCNSYNMSALHIACCLKPPREVVEAILTAAGDAKNVILSPSLTKGNTPLHLACLKGASYDALKVLLQNGGSIDKNFDGMTPIQLLMENYEHNQQYRGFLGDLGNSDANPMKFSQSIADFWLKSSLLLRAMFLSKRDSQIAVPDSLPVFSPLLIKHTAFAVSQFRVPASLYDFTMRVFLCTIKMFPSLCQIKNGDDRYLLNISLENHIIDENCISAMIKAAPKVLLVRDKKFNVYPFQLAAAVQEENLEFDDRVFDRLYQMRVSTIFNVLRGEPSVVDDGFVLEETALDENSSKKRRHEVSQLPSPNIVDAKSNPEEEKILSPEHRFIPKKVRRNSCSL